MNKVKVIQLQEEDYNLIRQYQAILQRKLGYKLPLGKVVIEAIKKEIK